MGGDLLVYLPHYALGLPVLHDHPPHLHVELVIDLGLHALIHGLHELLHDILNFGEILVGLQPLIEALLEVHHARVVGNFGDESFGGLGSDLFQYLQYQFNHAVLTGTYR